MSTAVDDSTWEPGIPLFGAGLYTNYLYNFREETDSEECKCGDRASWPDPEFAGNHLPEDPLENFLTGYRQWEKEQTDG